MFIFFIALISPIIMVSKRWCKYYSECKALAITVIPNARLHLCKAHFLHYVEHRVTETIEKKHLISTHRPDKVLLALSGGKDSQVLLHILHKLYGNSIQMEGIYIELGIHCNAYSAESERIARQSCEQLGIPFHVINIKESYGLNIDEIHAMITAYGDKKKGLPQELFKGECSYCGAYKRYSINKYAVEHGFTKVATGHNLTDESTALLVNFFNAELNYLSRSGSINNSESNALVPRIKPLFYTSEEEVMLYAYYSQIPHVATECEYAKVSPNPKIKKELQELEKGRPGLILGWMRQYQKKLKPILVEQQAKITAASVPEKKCSVCGMPSAKKKCAFCRQQALLMKRFEIMNTMPSKSKADQENNQLEDNSQEKYDENSAFIEDMEEDEKRELEDEYNDFIDDEDHDA
jgi:uncharacterized protein (TIGR00269 family)